MDKIMTLVLVLLSIGGIIWLTLWLTFGHEAGGWMHGKWIVKTNIHDCNHPPSFNGESGDQWQCRRCSRIWEYRGFDWK